VVFDGMTNEQIAEMAREDFSAARRSRQETEERKLDHYRLYRLFRKELRDGGKGDSNGPFQWSRLSVPIVFWICETILPRVGVNTPTIIAKGQSPQAMLYQQAKQLRINHQLKRSRFKPSMLLTLKQFLILGDGPVKIAWDADLGGPRMVPIDWFDWFLSPDAALWHDAEVMFHRTWHTQRSIKALMKRDANRRDPLSGEPLPRLYDHKVLERISTGSAYREATDETYAARRDAAGLGTTSWPADDGPIALVECQYRDGCLAVIAGDESPLAARVEREPIFTTPTGKPFRNFAVFQNTPDLFQPYGISDAEMVADHQHESSTLKNQAMDQGTGNINAPKGYNRNKVDPAELQAAWSQPNGVFATDGPPSDAVVPFPPGQLSGDVERLLEHNRREAQETVGANDIVQGIAASQAQTATEIASLREEANLRWALKLMLVEFGCQEVAQLYDWTDRLVARRSLSVPTPNGFELDQGARGVTMLHEGKFARVDTAANAPGMDYELTLEAGSLVTPNKSEEAEKLRALITDVAAMEMVAPLVNWTELLKMLVEVNGYDPERILLRPNTPVAGTSPAAPDGPPKPGEEPVGEPVPLQGGPQSNGAQQQPAPTPA
jgi:hypothetical protein